MHQRRPSRTTKNTTTNGNGSSDMYNDVEGGGSNARRGRNNNASSGGRSSDANSGIMEQQNNERIDELSGQVARLKGLTIDIGNEVREQNNLLDGIGDGFANAGDLLQGSLRRIGTMLEQGGSKHMCYMVSFIVGVMVFLWWLMTFKGKSGA
jgi:blocked-early-in-transport protein 1